MDVREYTVYLSVKNQFESAVDSLTISLDPQLPCAIAGDDLHICRSCGDEESGLYNSEYVSNVLSSIQFDAS